MSTRQSGAWILFVVAFVTIGALVLWGRSLRQTIRTVRTPGIPRTVIDRLRDVGVGLKEVQRTFGQARSVGREVIEEIEASASAMPDDADRKEALIQEEILFSNVEETHQ